MGWMNTESDAEPLSADGLLAEAIKRDVCGRLEQAMYDDEVIAGYLQANEGSLTVTIDVAIDRDLKPTSKLLQLDLPDDEPFAGVIGAPAVAAMVVGIKRRLRQAPARPLDELAFEVVVNPDRISLRGA